MFISLLKIISLLFQSVFVASSVLGIPGNIISLIFPMIWWLTGYITGMQFAIILVVIGAGEVFEQMLGIVTGKKAGLNNRSMICSFIGAIVLGILMSPIMFGLGAIAGAFIGAFAGAFIYEYLTTKDMSVAIDRGFAALKGRVLGTILKLALGVSSIIISTIYMF